MSNQTIPTIVDDWSQMYRTNYMGFASFTVLIWDHIDTFVAEVEYIWKGKKGLLVYLFLINRYLTPLGFIVNLFAYLSPVWTPEKYVASIRVRRSMTVIGINIVALMMFIRIRALYHRQYYVLGVVAFLFLFQVCMNGWLLTRGEAVVHNPGSHIRACTMIFDPAIAIFAVTAVLTIMIIAAPPGLKNITAQLELLLTVAMMSRITLNLKKSVRKLNDTGVKAQLPSLFTQRSQLSVNPDIKIVAPGFNQQTATTQTLDVDNEFPMSRWSKRKARMHESAWEIEIGEVMANREEARTPEPLVPSTLGFADDNGKDKFPPA
ncbi:hypothetical protein NLJ89_g1548 [Agrocybe chaxingu]|uniref:DUF6533 domain-containing protein n=1 Tax=Agrocybe chaxingu TaxID=84603 RepID=A0A9W8TE75_9AGAR|nr:hypothetical protein NLJ89_g1548 [Agrocybe chaxingu]